MRDSEGNTDRENNVTEVILRKIQGKQRTVSKVTEVRSEKILQSENRVCI